MELSQKKTLFSESSISVSQKVFVFLAKIQLIWVALRFIFIIWNSWAQPAQTFARKKSHERKKHIQGDPQQVVSIFLESIAMGNWDPAAAGILV
jgi:hypothetical protein